jgi:gamma-glutamylcyclotransferase (GGCT)/AIG2-like uncharacterized protein YtfP
MELQDDLDLLAGLDAYEGYDPQNPESEYIRELQRIDMEAGGTMECWFYRYNWKVRDDRRILSGDWLKRKEP